MRPLVLALVLCCLGVPLLGAPAGSGDEDLGIITRVEVTVQGEGSPSGPLPNAVVSISYPSGSQQLTTDPSGRVSFDLPVDASLASLTLDHPRFPECRIAYVHWVRQAGTAKTTVRLRNLAPFPSEVKAWVCRAAWVRRTCAPAEGTVAIYDRRLTGQPFRSTLVLGQASLMIPFHPSEMDIVLELPDGSSHYFADPPIDMSLEPPAAYLVVDGGGR